MNEIKINNQNKIRINEILSIFLKRKQKRYYKDAKFDM